MKLKDWREKKKLSQVELAEKLSMFAGEEVSQRKLSSWEIGHMPRKEWLQVVREFTKGKVTATDFAE